MTPRRDQARAAGPAGVSDRTVAGVHPFAAVATARPSGPRR